jgi:tripartite-type tricarboxylate transporter receptor subunit TctC
MISTSSAIKRRLLAYTILGLATAAGTPIANAQEGYPSRPITIVVGYTAGGANDILARIVGEKMSASLRQPVVVENRPGVASIVGAAYVANAKPDGYTLLMGASGPMSFNPSLYKKLPYSPESLIPISLVGTFPLVLLTQASNPSTSTLLGLVQYARANPKAANYSSSAASFQLITELFIRQSGTAFVHIPYKGSNESIAAVAAGDSTMTLVDSGPAMTAVRGGRVRPLAITAPTRAAYLPDTPTMRELGIPMDVELWSGLFAPAGTPSAIVQKLEQAVQRAVSAPDVQQRIKDLSINPKSSTSQELGHIVSTEIAQWRKVAADAGIEPN